MNYRGGRRARPDGTLADRQPLKQEYGRNTHEDHEHSAARGAWRCSFGLLAGLRRAGEDHQYRPRLLLRRALCRQAGEAVREVRARAGHLLRPGRRAGAAGGADQAGRCQHPELRAHAHRRRAGQAHRRVLSTSAIGR